MNYTKILDLNISILNKDENPILPDNVVKYYIITSDIYMDETLKPYVNINFMKQKLLIMYLDPFRHNERVAMLYDALESTTGITRDQIKGKRRIAYIVFARQLFHFGFLKCRIGCLKKVGKETGNHHATVLHSLKIINNTVEYGNGWRKEFYIKFIKELEEKKLI